MASNIPDPFGGTVTSVPPHWNVQEIVSGNGPVTVSNSSIKDYNYIIKGDSISVSHTVSELDTVNITENDIKRILITKLVDELFANGRIEFTKLHDQISGDIKCRARIFATPDDQVRILRTAGQIK